MNLSISPNIVYPQEVQSEYIVGREDTDFLIQGTEELAKWKQRFPDRNISKIIKLLN